MPLLASIKKKGGEGKEKSVSVQFEFHSPGELCDMLGRDMYEQEKIP